MDSGENEVLTQTGRGTPCGELMRRYWQPAALSEELPPGGSPLPVRLLGEDLVLFRDDRGRPGLLGIHCSHRGADLSYGRLEDGGLRCIYHGWLYDIEGRCLDQPGEPGGGAHRDAIRHLAYPCREKSGVIFAYMGPGEPPLLPNYDWLTVPDENVAPTKLFSESNYLQGNEGNIDIFHNNYLHFIKRDLSAMSAAEVQSIRDRFGDVERVSGRGPSPGTERTNAQLLDLGVRICKVRRMDADRQYIRAATFVLPSMTVIPGGSINWHVPIDDTHHWKYIITFSREKALDKETATMRASEWAPAPDYRPMVNKANRYGQDRSLMQDSVYCGIDYANPIQDLCVVEGAGLVQDRTNEHLMESDVPIVVSRKVLMKAIHDVQEGVDPPHVIRDPEANRFPQIVATFGVIPSTTRWKDHLEQLVAEGQGWQTLSTR